MVNLIIPNYRELSINKSLDNTKSNGRNREQQQTQQQQQQQLKQINNNKTKTTSSSASASLHHSHLSAITQTTTATQIEYYFWSVQLLWFPLLPRLIGDWSSSCWSLANFQILLQPGKKKSWSCSLLPLTITDKKFIQPLES